MLQWVVLLFCIFGFCYYSLKVCLITVFCLHNSICFQLVTPEKIRYPFTGGRVGPRALSGRVRKIAPSPGYDPRTLQPVASRYASYKHVCQSVVFHYCYKYRQVCDTSQNTHKIFETCWRINGYVRNIDLMPGI